MPWMQGDDAITEAGRTLYLFPLAWWKPEFFPPLYELAVWALADLDRDVQGLSFERWATSPDDVRDPDSPLETALLGRMIFPVDVYPKTPRGGIPSWRFTIPEELREAGCLPEHVSKPPRSILVFPVPGLLTIWRIGAWRACGPNWKAAVVSEDERVDDQ